MPKCYAFLFLLYFLLSCLIPVNHSSNVLCMFTSSAKSQLRIFMSVANTLIDRGHNVTVVTTIVIPRESESKMPYHHVLLDNHAESLQKLNYNMLELSKDPFSKINAKIIFYSIINMFTTIQRDSVEHEQFQRFLQLDNHFDLMLLGYYHNDYLVGVAARYGCPVAVISLGAPYGPISRLIGNPEATSFVQFPLFGKSHQMSFVERLWNFLWAALEPIIQVYTNWIMEGYYRVLFPAEFYPKYSDVINNISLVLSNHHFSMKPVRPLVPALVEIGGVEFKEKPDPLPEDVQAFMDSSHNGTILYSVGSKVHETLLSPDKLYVIINVLSRLDQKVLWQWEQAGEPPKIPNILFRRSLPLEDICFHQSVKLFITDGRRVTVYAALNRGLPLIAIPLHAQEPFTVARIVNKGFGVALDINNLTELSLKTALDDVLVNQFYTQKIKQFSRLYWDRPLTPRQTAAYWLEYVIRYRGAQHMQSPLVHMDLVKRWNIDLILVVWVSVSIFIRLSKFVVFLVRRCLQFRAEKLKICVKCKTI